MHERAGQSAQPQDSIDASAALGAYYDFEPSANEESQKVVFEISEHRGSFLDRIFNKAHVVATTVAIVEYRRQQGTDRPLLVGCGTHALSKPAWKSTLKILATVGAHTYTDTCGTYTPTLSALCAILKVNGTGTPGGVRLDGVGLANDIAVTPLHNPSCDGGFKYNPPHDGPTDSDTTSQITVRTNEILREDWRNVPRKSHPLAADCTERFDFLPSYVDSLVNMTDVDAIESAGVYIGADPLGGATVDYWAAIVERYDLNLTMVNEKVDPTWSFMTLDWDSKIRMDCPLSHATAALRKVMEGGPVSYDIATGNDVDSGRRGIVTAGGLMNPNHYLAMVIEYLYTHRSGWDEGCAMGKVLVSSALINRMVVAMGRKLIEASVGFKHFVPGPLDGSVGLGGEESTGTSLLRKDGTVWTTDKDGIVATFLASEILAVTGRTPSQLHFDQVQRFRESFYQRVDASAAKAEKAKLARLTPQDVTASRLTGQNIMGRLVEAPDNEATTGGLKVTTADVWFAARPPGTKDVYKTYVESFQGPEHLKQVQAEAKQVVAAALASS